MSNQSASWTRSIGIKLCAAVCAPVLALSAGTAHAADGPASGSIPTGSVGPLLSSQNNAPVVKKGQVDEFYNINNVTPATPGEILRQQKTSYSRFLGDADFTIPTEATKIMYTSTAQDGTKVPVTGYVVEPIVEWKGQGPRPTLIVGRGTVGQGDQCAPSRQWPLDKQPDPLTSGRLVNFEGLYDWAFLNQGVRVVVTDYVGMGTDLMHTYMNRLDQAHAMLDAARAAKNIVGEDNFGSVGFYGHSQGGGASAAAVEEATNYAPELKVAGAYSSAPPADLKEVQKNIDGSDLVGAIGFSINGLIARYPELKPILDSHLSEKGQGVLKDLETSCTDEITDKYGHQTTGMWTKDGRSLDQIVQGNDLAQKAMDDQLIGKGVNQAPVMIISGRYDENVEYQQAKTLAKRWCEKGGQVVYRDDILPQIEGYNHFIQSISGGAFGLTFMLDRFHGRPVTNTCNITDEPQGSSIGGSSVTGAVEASSGLSSAGSLDAPLAGSAEAAGDGRASTALGSLTRGGSEGGSSKSGKSTGASGSSLGSS